MTPFAATVCRPPRLVDPEVGGGGVPVDAGTLLLDEALESVPWGDIELKIG